MHLNDKNNNIAVSLVLIPHNDRDRFKLRLERDLLPTILAHAHWDFQIVIIDNGETYQKSICQILDEHGLDHTYIWPGENILYGPAMNLAVCASDHPYVVYACANHGRMYDPTWIDDLVEPLAENANIAMAGSLSPGAEPTQLGFPAHLPKVHIQGGLFGARLETLRKYPYTLDQRWAHGGSDHYQSFQLMQAGFTLQDVSTVKSVWWPQVVAPGKWKYIHDYSEK